MALLIAGCGPQAATAPEPTKASEPTQAPQAAEKVPVTVLSMGADWLLTSLWDSATGAETPLLTEFEEMHGIDIIFEALPEDTARQKTMLDFSSHTG